MRLFKKKISGSSYLNMNVLENENSLISLFHGLKLEKDRKERSKTQIMMQAQ
jgi:hypothetical protein